MTPVTIEYLFTLPNQSRTTFRIQLDPEDLSLISTPNRKAPLWTNLSFHQCPNCPLDSRTHPNCPLAASLTDIVADFESLVSYDKVVLEVKTSNKVVRAETSVQEGVGSLMGLVIATSGCPHMVYFRPMARFHAPIADEVETIYRAASMYLLAQFFKKREGQPADLGLEGLADIYRQVQVVNAALIDRLRTACESDSALNALIYLDLFAKTPLEFMEESLEGLRPLFKPFLSGKTK